MPTPEVAVLQEFERQFATIADEWRRSFLAAREARLKYRAIPTALFEQANNLGAGKPELAAAYRAIAARLADNCRQLDIDLTLLLGPCRFDFIDLRPAKEEFAAVAQWRARINDALAPLFEQQAQAAALAADAAQRLADAQQAVAEARQQLAAAEAKAREPSIDQARQALKAAEQQLAAMAKEPAR